MDDLLQEFLSETTESLAVLDVELVRFERESSDATILSNIFRLMHTIKGTCGFLGLPRLGAVAHAGENILGKFRDGELDVTPRAVTLILKAIDQIRALLTEMESTGVEPEGSDADLIDEINAMASAGAAPAPVLSEAPAGGPSFSDDGFPVAAELLVEVAHALKHEGVPSEAAPEAPAPEPEVAPIAEPARAAEAPARAADAPRETETKEPSNASIRVNVDVIENLMTLISELVLTRNQLLQMQRGQKDNEFKVPLQRLSHITSDLQDGVTRMRMQPIGNAWNKLPRIVRDLTVATGKKIELTMQGAETELDRQVLEMIKDPLTHMVRNSADHGIEDGISRLAAGKPETGTIALNAYHESGHIFIRIADDGKGLDLERIRSKAVTNGLTTEAAIAGMSEQQILQFIFRPGFSTAEKVTSVSGRGVGMDVVRTNIERIGGTIELSSVAGKGTTFLIKIPLTLAIVSALIVEAQGQRFAIPQLNVVELVGVSDRSEARVETINTSPVLRLRDRLLPLVSLRGALGLEPGSKATNRFVIVAQVGANIFGIIVDRVFDTEEIVVKPVAPLLRGTRFYVGNTILGDGSVIMILDPNGLSQAAGQIEHADQAAAQDKTGRAGSQGGDQASFLLFRTAGSELKAIPLELVSRIEGLDAASIEHVGGGRHVVQYRDHLMPLVPFDAAHRWKETGQQEILVFSDNGRSMGLAVDEVVDIVRDRMAIELSSGRPGLLGSAIIAGKAVDIVDVGHFLTQAFSDWFDTSAALAMARHALLVDDSPFFRNLVAPLLTSANWKVTTAADGAEALKLREAGHQFDVIISDIEMPNLNGLALASAIRNDPRWNKVPLIALSSHAEEGDVHAGREAGFDEYLAKSDQMRLTENLARVLRLAGRSEAQDNLRRAS
ncbi:MAG TPA: hybrid sensor histidine kinase/response regulator [Rhizomicrobium sp.]|nr:hybrid sensor histidine kinase/response regulator [Rhizomicrobium sp.]